MSSAMNELSVTSVFIDEEDNWETIPDIIEVNSKLIAKQLELTIFPVICQYR